MNAQSLRRRRHLELAGEIDGDQAPSHSRCSVATVVLYLGTIAPVILLAPDHTIP